MTFMSSVLAHAQNSNYVPIENCYVDCWSGDVENLTEYISKNVDTGNFETKFEKIIPASLDSSKYWILYSINNGSHKTPYNIWACWDSGKLGFHNKWDKKSIDALTNDEQPYLSCDIEFEEMKSAALAGIGANDGLLSYQQIRCHADEENMWPQFNVSSIYTVDGTNFSKDMLFVYNKDIIPCKTENWSEFAAVDKKLDISKNFSALREYFIEKIPGFRDCGFEIEKIYPANANSFYIDSTKNGVHRPLYHHREQKTHIIYGFTLNGMATPYKVETVVSKNKIEYRFNFSADDIENLFKNEFVNKMTVPPSEVQKAVEKCQNTAESVFNSENNIYNSQYDIISLETCSGLDSELRFYVDVKSVYEDKKYGGNSKLCVYSRYYASPEIAENVPAA